MSDKFIELKRRLDARAAVVGIIGLGYVGLPMCLAAVEAGLKVIGFDIDPSKPEKLLRGLSYLKQIPNRSIQQAINTGRFVATTNLDQICEPDALLICVPTPLDARLQPDLSFVESAGAAIKQNLRSGQLIVLESTTYPGTTSEVLRPILEQSGLIAGQDFYLAYSPERQDPGNDMFPAATITKIVGADDDASLDAASILYKLFINRVVEIRSSRVAEAAKLMENIFRSVNIALVNELKIVFEAMQIDIWEVINAAASKPFGFTPFYPGPGTGGHCIPIDPYYLSWKAKQHGTLARISELASEINSTMPDYVVRKLARELKFRAGKDFAKAEILIVGVAYKKNIDDVRESPALPIMALLEELGAKTAFYDPHVAHIPSISHNEKLPIRASLLWSNNLASNFDAAIIVTDHDAVDYAAIVTACPLVIDTRNACRNVGISATNVVQA